MSQAPAAPAQKAAPGDALPAHRRSGAPPATAVPLGTCDATTPRRRRRSRQRTGSRRKPAPQGG